MSPLLFAASLVKLDWEVMMPENFGKLTEQTRWLRKSHGVKRPHFITTLRKNHIID